MKNLIIIFAMFVLIFFLTGCTCKDSDGGFNISTAGITTKGWIENKDYCGDGYTLIEYFCSDKSISGGSHTCICNNGACVDTNINASLENCTETDNGKDIYNFGNIQGISSYTNKLEVKTDACIGNENKLREWYCKDNLIYVEDIECEFGCSNRACNREHQSSYCIDSDGGVLYFQQGIVTLTESGKDIYYTDKCLDNRTVMEYSCGEFDILSKIEHYCEFGCKDGACIEEADPCYRYGFLNNSNFSCGNLDIWKEKCGSSGDILHDVSCSTNEVENGFCISCQKTTNSNCTDSDGKNIFVKGSGKGYLYNGNLIEGTDKCIEQNGKEVLVEYFCGLEFYSMSYVTCTNGCQDGRCLYQN